jgi:alpha-maltose-1-phosphate synthase
LSAQPDIVVVNVTSAPGALGGAVLAAQWHSWYMARKRSISLWRMWDRTENTLLDELPIRNFASRPRFGWFGRMLPVMLQKVLLKSDIVVELKRSPPKLVHLQNPAPSLEFAKIAAVCKKQGVKVVASTHGFQECFDPHYGFDKLHQRIGWNLLITRPLRRAFRDVDAFLLGFPEQGAFLTGMGVPASKLFLVQNGIDPYFDAPATEAECDEVRRKFCLDEDTPILLFMGNHTLNKGLGTLMQLAASLEVPATVIVGGQLRDGEPEKWLDDLIVPHHVRVVFTDFLSVAEQRAFYHISRIFVFPSISETLPLVVLEAMAAGLPTVAFATGGIGHQLAEGAGFALSLHDHTAFKAAVLSLLTDDTLHASMSKASRERQRELFAWDALADKTIAVYDQLLSK